MGSRKELTNGKYIDDSMGNGIPEGGTTGQVLIKSSNADYDVEWGVGIKEGVVTEYGSYDLNSGPITLPEGGKVYFVTADDNEVYILTMPVAGYFPGQSITIINRNAVHPIVLFTSNSSQSIYKSYSAQLNVISPSGIITITSILNKWYVLDNKGY